MWYGSWLYVVWNAVECVGGMKCARNIVRYLHNSIAHYTWLHSLVIKTNKKRDANTRVRILTQIWEMDRPQRAIMSMITMRL